MGGPDGSPYWRKKEVDELFIIAIEVSHYLVLVRKLGPVIRFRALGRYPSAYNACLHRIN
jgi:hypothetical protein